MNDRPTLRRGAAVLACAASLAGIGAAVSSGAAAAAGATSCGSRTIMVSSKGGKSLTVPISRIRVEGGATCHEAVAVIRGALTKNLPGGWVLHHGNFKVPQGLTAQMATKGAKKVEYATVGH